jgi:hypothetical protein
MVVNHDACRRRHRLTLQVSPIYTNLSTFVDKIRLGNFLKIHIRPPLVYRLQDGSFHRVITANLLDPAVIVRIPRFEYGPPLADQVAILFLHS